MCTAVSWGVYFGRNLDLERGYGEKVVITPRNFVFQKGFPKPLKSHYALIGMAAVMDNYPLYFEATNEKGLSMAGLNFPENAVYFDADPKKDNIPPYALIPWVLGQCANLEEVRQLLKKLNLTNENFSETLPLSPLHFLISDQTGCLVVESVGEGLKLYDNPFGVLTNNPPFPYHRLHLNDFMALHAGAADNRFDEKLPLHNYSLGMGALGLPGDFSSASRFIRAFFVKENSAPGESETEKVTHFFHILQSVAMPKGCVWTKNGYEYTRYTSCCNAERGIYYYTTYENLQPTAVYLHGVALDTPQLYAYDVTLAGGA